MASQIDGSYDSFVSPQRILNRPPDNPFFTGREKVLDEIHNRLTRQRPTAITQRQAISGLGGIGKTQLAIKYVYRYADDYQHIFWVNAESNETIIQEYVKIAKALEMPESDDQNQQHIVAAVRQWLETNSGWLLVLDNADNLRMVAQYIPDAMKGHLLLTTREQKLDRLAESVPIDYMTLEEGMQLLLRRAKVIPYDGTIDAAAKTYQRDAEQIVKELGGLPLALDQSGAYIEETGGSLANYLTLYQGLGAKLLNDRRGIRPDHPASVVKTFLLALDKVERENATAVNVLRLCAFLAAEDIPEHLIIGYLPDIIVAADTPQQTPQARLKVLRGSSKQPLPTPVESRKKFDEACETLLNLSLIRRENDVISVHRLVQAVLKEAMPGHMQFIWPKNAIRVVNAAFPNPADESTWPGCEKLLTHALVCVQLINTYAFTISEASQLLNNVGLYLTERARYAEAQPILERALLLRETGGEKSPLFAESLHNLAVLYERQDKYSKAEQYLNRALRIRERELGENDPATAKSLDRLAQLYRRRNKLAEAEPLFKRALEINWSKSGVHDAATLQSLKNLATLYVDQKKYESAEDLYRQALEYSLENSKEKPGSNLITAGIMQDFAELYKLQSNLEEAEKLYKEALRIRKEMLGEHPDVATSLNSMAELLNLQGKSGEAEQLFKEALTMREKVLGRESTDAANSFYSLAVFYKGQGNLVQAEQYYKNAQSIWEKNLELNNPLTMQVQEDLAELYEEQKRDAEAESIRKRGLDLRFQKLKPDDPKITQNLQVLTTYYEKRPDATDKLERLLEQAFNERAKKLGIYHPVTRQILGDLIKFYKSKNKAESMERLLRHVFILRSQVLRGDRPETIKGFEQSLQELAQLYDDKNSLAEKTSLYKQALQTCYEKLGYSDRLSKKCFRDLMSILGSQGDSRGYQEAKLFYAQEFERRVRELNINDPASIQNYFDEQHEFADIFEQQKQFEDAEQLLEQTLETSYKKLGVDDPHTIQELHSLVELYESHKKAAQGIRLYKQDIEICKLMKLELEHPRMIESYNNLARYYLKYERYEDAEPIVEKMRQLCEPTLADNYIPFDRKPLSQEYLLAAVQSLLNAAKIYSENYAGKIWQKKAEKFLQKALQVSMEKLDEAAQNEARESLIEFLMKAKRFEEAAALRINATMMKKQENGQQE